MYGKIILYSADKFKSVERFDPSRWHLKNKTEEAIENPNLWFGKIAISKIHRRPSTTETATIKVASLLTHTEYKGEL